MHSSAFGKKRRNRDWGYDDYDENYEEDDEIENNHNQLEGYDDNMNYVGEEKELSKEDARKKFLENYDNDKVSNSYKDIEEPKAKRHKGKRFK